VFDQKIFSTSPQDWKELQSFVSRLFSEAGFEVESPKVVNLARGQKEIDVFVIDQETEYRAKILVECKYWNKPVSQEIVHAFRTVMTDCGGNIGYIISKSGFQSGCYDAIKHTNIHLATLEELEQQYYARWLAGMVKKSMSLSDILFPYWDPIGGKRPLDGKPINWDHQQLLDQAYRPFLYIDSRFMDVCGPIFDYPIRLPVIDDKFEVIGQVFLVNDQELFDFIEANKERALSHYQLLYREK
jgi:hypothetical protein